jgi:hypothetical protein
MGFSSVALVRQVAYLHQTGNARVHAAQRRHAPSSHADVGFQVLRAVVTKRYIFWDVTPCSP